MKILFFTDSHITAKLPRMRIDKDINETFIQKFKDVIDTARDNNVDMIIHGGDMFHSPDVSNKLVGEIAKVLKPNSINTPPIYVCAGNHDLQGQNIETLPFTKLGLLGSTGVIRVMSRETPLLINDNVNVKIEFQEYYHGIDGENKEKDYSVNREGADVSILVTHSMLLDKPFLEQVNHTVIKDVNTDADLVLSGHYHEGFDAITHNNTLFINPGSSFRVDYTKHNQNNMPKMVLITINDDKSIEYEFIHFKSAKPFNEVFDVNAKLKQNISSSIEEFNKRLKNISVNETNIVDILNNYVYEHEEFKECKDRVLDLLNKETKMSFVDPSFEQSNNRIIIEKVELKNFQVHEKLEVNFTDGVNAILGPSNSGKTSILRAINWVLYDTPKGANFITSGKPSCSVTVHLSNGFSITRARSRSSSGSYKLKLPNGEVKEFRGFSNNIPSMITNAHQMPEITIVDKKYRLNVANQLDGPFMIGASSNDKMNIIGALADTDRADKLAKELKGEAQQSASVVKLLEKELDEINEKIESFSDITLIEQSIKKIENIEDVIKKSVSNIELISKIKDKYKAIDDKISYINSNTFTISKDLINNIQLYNKYLEEYNNIKSQVFDKYETVKIKLNETYIYESEIDTKIEKLSGVLFNVSKSVDDISDLTKSHNDLQKSYNVINDLNSANEHLDKISVLSNIIILKEEYIESVKMYLNLKESFDKYNENAYKTISVCDNIKILDIEINNKEEEIKEAYERLKGCSYVCSECGTLIEY